MLIAPCWANAYFRVQCAFFRHIYPMMSCANPPYCNSTNIVCAKIFSDMWAIAFCADPEIWEMLRYNMSKSMCTTLLYEFILNPILVTLLCCAHIYSYYIWALVYVWNRRSAYKPEQLQIYNLWTWLFAHKSNTAHNLYRHSTYIQCKICAVLLFQSYTNKFWSVLSMCRSDEHTFQH